MSKSIWREILRSQQEKALVERIRLNTHRGRPLATDRVLTKLEHTLGERLRPLPVGRPKKPDTQAIGKQAKRSKEGRRQQVVNGK